MVLGKMKRSRCLFASMLCAAALACGQDEPNNGQPGPGPGGQPAGGTSGGSPVVTGDGGVPPGTAGGPGGGTTGGAVPGGGTTGGGMTGGGPIPQVDAGPPDLGMNSQGDTFFRAETLVLKSPNLVLNVPFLGCQPVTSTVQDIVNAGLTNDANSDRIVDLSLLIRFLKVPDPRTTNAEVTVGGGRCAFPAAPGGSCGPEPIFPFQSPAVSYANSQNCMLQETTEVSPGACFSSALTSLAINVPLLGPVPLQDGQVVGTWQDGNIANGHVRGFLSIAAAMNTKLPTDLSAIPPEYQLVLTPGGPIIDHLCADQKAKNSRGEEGWWFVFDFTAKPAVFSAAPTTP